MPSHPQTRCTRPREARAVSTITSVYFDSLTGRPSPSAAAAADTDGDTSTDSSGSSAGARRSRSSSNRRCGEDPQRQWAHGVCKGGLPPATLQERLLVMGSREHPAHVLAGLPLPVYHTRMRREDGSALLRLRWVASNRDRIIPKLHHELENVFLFIPQPLKHRMS